MFLNDLENLTYALDASFAGASPTNFTKQWSLPLSDGGTQGVQIAKQINIHLPQPESVSPEMLQRLFCHLLIELIPTAGLPEARETLIDLLHFYKNRTVTQSDQLTENTVITGDIVAAVVRPSFSLDIDEL